MHKLIFHLVLLASLLNSPSSLAGAPKIQYFLGSAGNQNIYVGESYQGWKPSTHIISYDGENYVDRIKFRQRDSSTLFHSWFICNNSLYSVSTGPLLGKTAVLLQKYDENFSVTAFEKIYSFDNVGAKEIDLLVKHVDGVIGIVCLSGKGEKWGAAISYVIPKQTTTTGLLNLAGLPQLTCSDLTVNNQGKLIAVLESSEAMVDLGAKHKEALVFSMTEKGVSQQQISNLKDGNWYGKFKVQKIDDSKAIIVSGIRNLKTDNFRGHFSAHVEFGSADLIAEAAVDLATYLDKPEFWPYDGPREKFLAGKNTVFMLWRSIRKVEVLKDGSVLVFSESVKSEEAVKDFAEGSFTYSPSTDLSTLHLPFDLDYSAYCNANCLIVSKISEDNKPVWSAMLKDYMAPCSFRPEGIACFYSMEESKEKISLVYSSYLRNEVYKTQLTSSRTFYTTVINLESGDIESREQEIMDIKKGIISTDASYSDETGVLNLSYMPVVLPGVGKTREHHMIRFDLKPQ